MRVLFPAPFSPRSACTVPRSTRKLMRSLAVREPKVLVMPSISSIRRGREAGPVLERKLRGPAPPVAYFCLSFPSSIIFLASATLSLTFWGTRSPNLP